MEGVIRKWGNSPALRLPVSVLKKAGLTLNQRVSLTITDRRIVIEPSDRIKYDLDQLVSRINAKNSHNELSVGASIGKEAL